MKSKKPKDDLCKHNICEKCHKEIRQLTAQEIFDNYEDELRLFHCNQDKEMFVEIHNKINQKYLGGKD